jgi:hypothetical protein
MGSLGSPAKLLPGEDGRMKNVRWLSIQHDS